MEPRTIMLCVMGITAYLAGVAHGISLFCRANHREYDAPRRIECHS